jgi:hypothetical protein
MSSQAPSAPKFSPAESKIEPNPSFIPSVSQWTALRHPPSAHLGHHTHGRSNQQVHLYDLTRKGPGSLSSASSNSSSHTASYLPAGPARIYTQPSVLFSHLERGASDSPRSPRAYPNQYTRASECEMAEINAARRHSRESHDDPSRSDDHAIWILVRTVSTTPYLPWLTICSFGYAFSTLSIACSRPYPPSSCWYLSF